MCGSSQSQNQHPKAGGSHLFQRLRLGILFAGVYLLVSVPCAVAYLLDRHEYSVPMFIVCVISFPTHFLIFQVLRPITLPLERAPYDQALGISILLVSTAILYFAVGQGVGWIARILARPELDKRRNR
jgi:hypothetical protein